MSAVVTHIRSSAPRHASPTVRRMLLGYLAALCVAPAITLWVLLAGAVSRDEEPPVSQVVEVRCLNGRVHYGIDTGRPDGLLLAKSTGREC